ncbi:uncharacterized protein LOC135605771 isoform X2 [Musa acuminata AAA Group]|uniref:uncharacterized protein LOC135605537 isoform X2 n=1 Tax=Musa acuminata AAA Group TaxID=214697 RepID=UPI0031DFF489
MGRRSDNGQIHHVAIGSSYLCGNSMETRQSWLTSFPIEGFRQFQFQGVGFSLMLHASINKRMEMDFHLSLKQTEGCLLSFSAQPAFNHHQ